MRIGKIQKQILQVLYEEEKKPKEKSKYFNYKGLRPRTIIERITKLKYPKEEVPMYKKWGRLRILAQCKDKEELHKLLEADPMTKQFKNLADKRKKFHNKAVSIYRAIKKLRRSWLIQKSNNRFGCLRFELTEYGRRVISHRINKLPLPQNNQINLTELKSNIE